MNLTNAGSICLSCLNKALTKSATCTVISKRSRYFWEARPECRERKRLMMITLPRLPSMGDAYLKKTKEEEKLYGLDVLLHKEVQEIFNNNRMIAVCLYSEQPSDDYYRVRYDLRQHNMNMEKYEKHIMEFTLKSTRYHEFLRLCDGPTAIIYGEPNVAKMIAAVKKNKNLLLAGGIVDGKYMSVPDLNAFASLPGLDGCRSELCGILSTTVSSTHDLLKRPAASLSMSLRQHAENIENTADSSA